jgi:hypothetical protein
MNRDQKAVIDWCIRSLTQEPEAWKCDSYQCEHRNGTTVWIANDHYGMAVYPNPQRTGGRVGGVNTSGSLLGWLIPWRRRLRHAALAAARQGCVRPEGAILANIEAA